MKPTHPCFVCHVSFLLACLVFVPTAQAQFAESTIAHATGNNSRNTEGDVVALNGGALLAVWSEYFGGDRGDSSTRLAAARSEDGGKTWGSRFTLVDSGDGRNVTSASLLRSTSGDVLLFYGVKSSPETVRFAVRRSSDEARTWSADSPVNAAPANYLMSNGRVLQLSDGRILAPTTLIERGAEGDSLFRTAVFFSDDDGETWQRSQSLIEVPRHGAIEPALFDPRNGEIWQLIRTELGKTWISYSEDRGETWFEAEKWEFKPMPPCNLVRLPMTEHSMGPMFMYHPEFGLAGLDFGRWRLLPASLAPTGENAGSERNKIEPGPDPSCRYQSAILHEDRILITYYAPNEGRYDLKFRSISVPERYRVR